MPGALGRGTAGSGRAPEHEGVLKGVDVDLYRVALPNHRSLVIAGEQVRRIAVGLGARRAGPERGPEPPVVAAVRALPPDRRADAFRVALLRFGHKQDLETICHRTGLAAWQVWQLEAAFRQALGRSTSPPRTGRSERMPVDAR